MDNIIIYKTLDSTNKEAQRLLQAGPVGNGTTLMAFEQTEGKGQMGREWLAEAGQHLAMTIIYQPVNLFPTELYRVSMKVSLGIIRALKARYTNLQPLIKWPNDIYISGKKLSGILIENTLAGQNVQHCIIGIGMNVNEKQFPASIPNATSVLLQTNQITDLSSIAHDLRHHVLACIEAPGQAWYAEYEKYIFGKNETHTFLRGTETREAKVLGINLKGQLVLEEENGRQVAYGTHEIKWMITE